MAWGDTGDIYNVALKDTKFFSFKIYLIFKLWLTFTITLVSGYSMVVRHLYNSPSDLFDKFSTHSAPHIVITILTIFPLLHFTSHNYFLTMNMCFLIPPHFSPSPPTPLHSGKHQFALCVWVCFNFVCSFVLCIKYHIQGPGWCGSVDWALAC